MTTMENVIDHSSTQSTSKNDGKWIQLADTPYWRIKIVHHTTPPIVIGGQDEQQSTTANIMTSMMTVYTNRWRSVNEMLLHNNFTKLLLHNAIIVAGETNARIL